MKHLRAARPAIVEVYEAWSLRACCTIFAILLSERISSCKGRRHSGIVRDSKPKTASRCVSSGADRSGAEHRKRAATLTFVSRPRGLADDRDGHYGSEMITEEQARSFAQEWIEAWNSHDLERILAHWADDCSFSSPLIVRVLNEPSGRVHGKEALRRYWRRGLEAFPGLHFELDTVYVGHDTLVITYLNHRGQKVAEWLRLNADLLAIDGGGNYGPLPHSP